MSNLTMKLSGYSWDKENDRIADTPSEIAMSQPFSDNSNTLGMPVSLEAFTRMQKKFFDAVKNGNISPGKAWSWNVSKASLLRILSHEDCEMLTFFLVIPVNVEDGLSLAITGRDKDKTLIKQEAFNKMAISLQDNNTPAALDTLDIPSIDEKVGKGFTDLTQAVEKHLDGFHGNIDFANYIKHL